MTKQEYIEWLAPRVVIDSLDRNLLPSPRIAQGCFEPAYGTSELAINANNLFGVKDNDQWAGPVYNKVSGECYDKKNYVNKASDFQKYDSWDDSIYWQGWYLENRCISQKYHPEIKHYAELIGNRDYKDCARILQEKSYGTSPEYAKRVIDYVERHDLTKYDSMTREEAEALIKKESGEVMIYTNSPLVDCTVLSPNHSGKRTHKIDRITPHCVVGQLSAESVGACFPNGRDASCNYGIGYDGRQCLIVEEKNRSWCTSSYENDQRAITIEVASDKTAPYAFTNEAYASLVELCVDICKRNNINKVLWFGNKEISLSYVPADGECVLTVHRWFANKGCPGDWLYQRMGQLASEINKAIGSLDSEEQIHKQPNDGKTLYRVQCGAYKNKENADKQLAIIKAKGIDAFVVNVDGYHKIQVGAYGIKANADKQLAKMKELGIDCFITTVSRESEAFVPRKSAEEIAKEIWTGTCSDSRWSTWGNGDVRKERLEIAGYNYEAIHNVINKLYG